MQHDYIIIGAGSAGCVLASRLSEDPAVRVLLLEAGGKDDKMEIHAPIAAMMLHRTEVDWAYHTEPQEHLDHRRLFWPRGKVLGGSSSINTMLHVRGHRKDYDGWKALGNEGWGYDDVLPYFIRSETYRHGGAPYHGQSGPLNVEKGVYTNPLWHVFVEVANKRGIPVNHDINGEHQGGAGIFDRTIKGGKRQSTAVAYLRPALARQNLEVRTHALVRRVVFEGTRAVAVELVQGSGVVEVRARREIILCAGAIESPKLLILSGVGPAAELGKHGIDTIVDLPGVGRNLSDHTVFHIAYLCSKRITVNSAFNRMRMLQYMIFKRGPLSIFPIGAYAYASVEDEDWPDVQFNIVSGWAKDMEDAGTPPKEDGFLIAPIVLRPRSLGSITLRSARLEDPPVIQPNIFADEYDVRLSLASYRVARDMLGDELFAPYRTRIVKPERELESDDEILAYLRRSVNTAFHPVGTCKMGVDDMAVVDSELKVHGAEGLRVVDASIMPIMVSGNTNAPVIMIAEKAADMVKAASR